MYACLSVVVHSVIVVMLVVETIDHDFLRSSCNCLSSGGECKQRRLDTINEV
eukprot:m.237481 g.237481  ORF g.237481 m.237481 type:complete len:52 (+) comp13927_c1_seq23:1031-1186(+)